jgi:photosystem II stability/assembly factor-like uncharacterized protein
MLRFLASSSVLLVLFVLTAGCESVQPAPSGPPMVTALVSGVEASLRGVDAWDSATVWACGTGGTVLKSTDGGAHWERVVIADAEALDFRDVELLDASTVLLMSVGSGDSSRIYKTTDAGTTWRLVLTNTEESAFYNGFAFWDASAGVLTSDSYDGTPFLLGTEDGGESWHRVGKSSLPPLSEGEYGFAASGTGIAVAATSHVWMATGGAAARIFASTDSGLTWEVQATPMRSGTQSSGIFSVSFRDAARGVAVGGDYQEPELTEGNAIWTNNGGRSWTLAADGGAMPHKAAVAHLGWGHYLAAGRTGLAYSQDDGHSWQPLLTSSYYAIAYHAASGVGWLVGAEGHVARFEVQ